MPLERLIVALALLPAPLARSATVLDKPALAGATENAVVMGADRPRSAPGRLPASRLGYSANSPEGRLSRHPSLRVR